MPLVFSGNQFTSVNLEKILAAHDGAKPVPVVTSQEALTDMGLSAVEQKAREKYAAGRIERNGTVKVTTADF